MPSVIVIGGGLAGLATAAALGNAGFSIDLYEARAFLGGRATSYPVNTPEGAGEVIDNCQHVLLRCCVNLLDLYRRLGVENSIQFHREFFFVEPGGRISTLQAGSLRSPFHFTSSFLRLPWLTLQEKLALGRGLFALRREYKYRKDLDSITMLDWLREKNQPQRLIDRFWSPVLVSAINEDLGRMAAVHGFQVYWLAFLNSPHSYEMGIPSVPLADLYTSRWWSGMPQVKLHMRSPVSEISPSGILVDGKSKSADYYVSALPFERLAGLQGDLPVPAFEHSPITGIHLWFDRSITNLPHATLLDRTVQWMFNKSGGKYLQLVVSASRSLVPLPRQEIINLAVKELAEFFPVVLNANLERAHVVKEVRATFSAQPWLEEKRPGPQTVYPNVFLAGDWTRSGWPATMEGAVRSGYIAAEAVAAASGSRLKFLLPDPA